MIGKADVSPSKLHALTGLRFFAALHVVIYHALRPSLVEADGPIEHFLQAGPTAVTLFFVLSGFVLTYRYGDRVDVRAFARSRLARLVPVYWLALLIVLPLGLVARAKGIVTDPLGVVSFVLVAAGLQAWVPEAALRWNPPAWSLSCEMFFYALYPVAAAVLLRTTKTRAVAVTAALWVVGTALPIAYVVQHGAPLITDDGTLLAAVKLNPLARLPDFVVGILAARMFREGKHISTPVAVAVITMTLVAIASGLIPTLVLHNALLAPAFAVVVVWLAAGDSVVARMLSSPPLQVLGDASYALYLLHVPMMMWTMAFTRASILSPAAALIACALAIPLSVAVERWVESPLRRRFTS